MEIGVHFLASSRSLLRCFRFAVRSRPHDRPDLAFCAALCFFCFGLGLGNALARPTHRSNQCLKPQFGHSNAESTLSLRPSARRTEQRCRPRGSRGAGVGGSERRKKSQIDVKGTVPGLARVGGGVCQPAQPNGVEIRGHLLAGPHHPPVKPVHKRRQRE